MKYAVYAVLGIFALAALAIVGNLAGTFSSVATAPGRVVQQTMETNNIITNYEWFHQSNATYMTRVSQIRSHKAFLASESDPSERNRIRIELVGMQQSCRELARTYNARATMTNRSIFMGKEAPESLDASLCE